MVEETTNVTEQENQPPVTDPVETPPSTDEGGSLEGSTEPPPEFNPEEYRKFQVYEENFEIPEEFVPLMTDKEKAEKIRDLHLKAYGLPKVQEKRDKFRTERDDYRDKYETASQQLDQKNRQEKRLKEAFEKDFGMALAAMGVSEDQILRHAAEILQFKDDPEKEAVYSRQRERDKELFEIKSRMEDFETTTRMQNVRNHENALEMAFNSPEAVEFTRVYDSKMGQGAFRKEVEDYGNSLAYNKNQYITPDQAVKDIINKFRRMFDVQTPPMNTQPQGGVVPPVGQQTPPSPRPASIPNIGSGSNVSPRRPRFKNLDDVKKYAQEKYGI